MNDSVINTALTSVVVSTLLVATMSGCATTEPTPEYVTPDYPRVSLSTSYVVDADWPRKPRHCTWEHVPGIAVEGKDRVWVFTRGEPPVQVYDTDGEFLFAWGEGRFKLAHHIEIGPAGSIWLCDSGLHVVQKYTEKGELLMTIGTPGEAGADETHMSLPTDMAITPAGDIFVTDGYGNSRVMHFDKNGRFVKQWGRLGTGPGEFSIPHAIALDSAGRLYVADRNNARIQVFDQSGKFIEEWRDLLVPWGLWVTKKDEIWACGSSPMTWRPEDEVMGAPPKDQLFIKFSTGGEVLQLWTVPKGTDKREKPGQLNWVHGMALDSAGNIYAGDIMGQRAQKFCVQK